MLFRFKAIGDRKLIPRIVAACYRSVILSLTAGIVHRKDNRRIIDYMNGSSHKVIGYFAIRKGSPYILCDGDACAIAGSEQSMNTYIVKLANHKPSNYKVKKTRYGKIAQGMRMGAVYTFDKRAYERFFPLAKAEGKPVVEFRTAE